MKSSLKPRRNRMSYGMEYPLASAAHVDERTTFIRRTYAHLAGAILAFTILEFAIFGLMPPEIAQTILGLFTRGFGVFILFALFIGAGSLARWWAFNGGSQAMQYAGLALYIVMEAVIFVPLLYVVLYFTRQPQSMLVQAGGLTLCVFGGLTVATFATRKDFSFLRTGLTIGSFVMLGAIVVGWFTGYDMGLFYSLFGIALACGYILYDTSNVIHRFRTDQHVAASLELFASVAYLFYNILWLLLQTQRRSN